MTERTNPVGRRTVLWVLTALLVVGTAGVASAASELRLEAEDFEAYGSYNVGGMDITASYCSYASGGLAVDGLDMPDEWIKLKLTIDHAGCYSSRIDYQSAYGDTAHFAVRVLDAPVPGEELRAEYVLTDGYGFG